MGVPKRENPEMLSIIYNVSNVNGYRCLLNIKYHHHKHKHTQSVAIACLAEVEVSIAWVWSKIHNKKFRFELFDRTLYGIFTYLPWAIFRIPNNSSFAMQRNRTWFVPKVFSFVHLNERKKKTIHDPTKIARYFIQTISLTD